MKRAKAVTRADESLTANPGIYQGKLFQPVWSTEHVLSTEHFHITVMFPFQKDVLIDQGDSLKFMKLQLHKIPCLQSN